MRKILITRGAEYKGVWYNHCVGQEFYVEDYFSSGCCYIISKECVKRFKKKYRNYRKFSNLYVNSLDCKLITAYNTRGIRQVRKL